jgi:hypothetical protein
MERFSLVASYDRDSFSTDAYDEDAHWFDVVVAKAGAIIVRLKVSVTTLLTTRVRV